MGYTSPRTWAAGERVTAALLNEQLRDNFLAAFPLGVDGWTDFTPSLTQSVTVTKTVTYAKYQRVGRMIVFRMKLTVTGSGTAANAVRIGLPVICAATADNTMGQGYLFDASAGLNYRALITPADADEVFMSPANSTVADVLGNTQFTAGLASTDVVVLAGTYEAAS